MYRLFLVLSVAVSVNSSFANAKIPKSKAALQTMFCRAALSLNGVDLINVSDSVSVNISHLGNLTAMGSIFQTTTLTSHYPERRYLNGKQAIYQELVLYRGDGANDHLYTDHDLATAKLSDLNELQIDINRNFTSVNSARLSGLVILFSPLPGLYKVVVVGAAANLNGSIENSVLNLPNAVLNNALQIPLSQIIAIKGLRIKSAAN
jgi:hypothetical protein